MRNSFIILFVSMLCLSARNRDFESFWQLYLDDKLVQQCDSYPNGCNVELKRIDLFLSHKNVTLKYFRDTPCDVCPISVQVRTLKDSLLFEATSYGTTTPISFPLRLFYEYKNFDSFKVIYKEKGEDGHSSDIQLFQFNIK